MGEVLLKVPAEHVAEFRRAALSEVESGCESVRDEAASALNLIAKGAPGDQLADLRDNSARLAADSAVVDQIGCGDGPAEVRADTEVLMGVAEAMARMTGRRLGDELDYAPVEPRHVEPYRDSLDWALAQVERLSAAWRAEREAVAA